MVNLGIAKSQEEGYLFSCTASVVLIPIKGARAGCEIAWENIGESTGTTDAPKNFRTKLTAILGLSSGSSVNAPVVIHCDHQGTEVLFTVFRSGFLPHCRFS